DVPLPRLQDVAVVERVIHADPVLIDPRSTLLDHPACGRTSRVPAELDQGPDEVGRVSRRVLAKFLWQLAPPEPAGGRPPSRRPPPRPRPAPHAAPPPPPPVVPG